MGKNDFDGTIECLILRIILVLNAPQEPQILLKQAVFDKLGTGWIAFLNGQQQYQQKTL